VFLLNKDTIGRDAIVTLSGYETLPSAARRVFTGTGPLDMSPTWMQESDVPVSGNQVSLTLAPVSVTVLSMAPARNAPAQPAGLRVKPRP
jgi:hypothetical protein